MEGLTINGRGATIYSAVPRRMKRDGWGRPQKGQFTKVTKGGQLPSATYRPHPPPKEEEFVSLLTNDGVPTKDQLEDLHKYLDEQHARIPTELGGRGFDTPKYRLERLVYWAGAR